MLLTKLYDDFIRKCHATIRPASVEFYSDMLIDLFKFLESINIHTVEELDFAVMYQFIEYKRSFGVKNISINKVIGAKKQALIFESNLMNIKNPLRDFPRLKQESQETKIIPNEYLQQIIKYVDDLPKKPRNLRYRAMVYLLIDTGIRLNELRHLKLSNIDFKTDRINLTFTKTHRHRTVFISTRTRNVLLEYISVANITDNLIVKTGTNEIRQEGAMRFFLINMKRELELPKDLSISFHKFRHTYATICLENGASLEFVRSTLGHTTLRETQKYIHLSHEVNLNQHKCYGPLNYKPPIES